MTSILTHLTLAIIGVAGVIASGNGLANLAELIRVIRLSVTRESAR